MKSRVLFIYPTPLRITGLPLGLASLTAVLKSHGHSVKIFDTAFYGSDIEKSQTVIRTERLESKEVTDEEKYTPLNSTRIEDDLERILLELKPDLIAFSILETMFEMSIYLARLIKKHNSNIPVLAGGVFPTLSPDLVIEEESFDMICVGEGETTLLQLCERISENKPFADIEGLWLKSNGNLIKNQPSKLHDINTLPIPDFEEFDQRLFYKPMQGKMYKMVNIATSRGCPNQCSYCGAPQLKIFFKDHDCGFYYRNLNGEKIIKHIQYQVKKHSPEFIYFSTENFLAMKEEDFQIFIRKYEKIKIPFWIQTRIETITKERIQALRDVGLYWITLGLEHGNEEFRKNVLNRRYSNQMFFERMDILRQIGMGASLNNMIGFPFETRELIFDTIRMNKRLYEENPLLECNVCIFTPFRGCKLYDMCRENGLLGDEPYTSSQDQDEKSVLKFSDDFAETLTGIVRTFNMYVRLPERYYGDIKIAERSTSDGDRMRKILLDIYHQLEQQSPRVVTKNQ
jgi:anaerobic magnesium-protoporphyrin IX monomethyl ester cyclase